MQACSRLNLEANKAVKLDLDSQHGFVFKISKKVISPVKKD